MDVCYEMPCDVAALSPASRTSRSAARHKLDDAVAAQLVGFFKLLADETRLRILHYLLLAQEYHVRALCDLLGQSQPAVSHHLALLRAAEILECRRSGKHNFYRLRTDRFQELLDVVFAGVPAAERQVRFGKYLLSVAPEIAVERGV